MEEKEDIARNIAIEEKAHFIRNIAIIIVIVTILFVIIWQSVKISRENKISSETETGSVQENLTITEEETANISEETSINETNNLNETSANETEEIDTGYIPNPTGSVTFISRKDSTGEYFCNKTTNPVHALKVYTYKIINGTKSLSEDYIESSKIKVCDDYNNATVTAGVTYFIEWTWDAVDKVDGYRVYQYFYLNANVSRNYNDSRDVKTNRFLDTGLDLWG